MYLKKLTLNSLLNHKATGYDTMEIVVEKVITLHGGDFQKLKRETLSDEHHIKVNRNLMYIDGDTAHCLLFVDNESSDGMVVESEGYGYARKSAFIPNARGILESRELTAAEWKIHEEIKSAAEKISEQAHAGEKHFVAYGFWNSPSVNINDLLLDALRTRGYSVSGAFDD